MAYVNSVSLVELQKVTITWNPNKTPVKTKKGVSGYTRGSGEVTVSFQTAVPMEGPEFDFVAAAHSDDEYRLQFPYGSKTITSEGQFTDGSLDGAIDSNADMGQNFHGTFNAPK